MDRQFEPLRIKRLMRACLRKWWCFLLGALASAVLIGAYIVVFMLWKPVYTSEALLTLEFPSSAAYDASTTSALDAEDILKSSPVVDSVVRLLDSRSLLARICDVLPVDIDPDDVAGDLEVRAIAGTMLIEVRFTMGEGWLAQMACQELIAQAPATLRQANLDVRVKVLDAPTLPAMPNAIGLPYLAILGVLLAGVLGVGLVLLTELFYSGFRTPQDIRRVLGLETLAILPRGARSRRIGM